MKVIYSTYGTETNTGNSTRSTSKLRALEIILLIFALLSSVALFAQGSYSSIAITEQNADMSSFVAMNVRFDGEASKISWKIKDATEPCTYVIQRGADRNEFVPIAKVIGLSTEGITEYFYTDTKPLAGPGYYRIIKVNKTGSYNYTAIYSVNEPTIETAGGSPAIIGSDAEKGTSPSITTTTVPNFR